MKTKTYLDEALSKAYDLGIEADFLLYYKPVIPRFAGERVGSRGELNMFYDMERDDPKEFKRRKNLLTNKKNKVKSNMKTFLCEMNKLRATTDGS